MNRSAIYNEVMHLVIKDGIGGKAMLLSPESFSYIESHNNAVSSLVMTDHAFLIDTLLETNINHRILELIIDAYLQCGKFERVLQIVRNHDSSKKLLDLGKLGKKCISRGMPDALLLRYGEILYLKDDTVNGLFLDFLNHIWEGKRFSLGTQMIQCCISHSGRDVLVLLQSLYEGHTPSITTVQDTLERLFMHQEICHGNAEIFSPRNMLIFFINVIGDAGFDREFLGIGMQILNEQNSMQKTRFAGQYQRSSEMLQHCIQKQDFEGAQQYAHATGNSRALLYTELQSAITRRDAVMHASTLKKYEEYLNGKLGPGTNSTDFCKITAEIACERSIFEILHGSESKAREYISEMMTQIEKISKQPTEKEIPSKVLRNERIAKKRELKERFMEVGLFHFLPKENGWSDPIKTLQEREEERKIRIRDKESERRELEEKENQRKMTQDVDIIEFVDLLLQENDISGAIDSIEECDPYMSRMIYWESYMYIIERSPEYFGQILRNIERNISRMRDEYGLMAVQRKGMIGFFIKAQELGYMHEVEWEIFFNLQEAFLSRDFFLDDMTVVLIEGIIQSDVGMAWKIFRRRWKMYKQFGKGADKLHIFSECLGIFIRALSNPESRDGSSAFSSYDVPSDASPVQKVSYWNIRVHIALAFKDETRYRESVDRLLDTISIAGDPYQSVRMWCRDLINFPMRNAHQIAEEVGKIQNHFSQHEKIKRKVVQTLASLKIHGCESSPEIKKKTNNTRIQRYYFELLMKHEYITQNTSVFLSERWKDHIHFLRRLLAQYQNEFNTVIDILAYDTTFEPAQWKSVFMILETLGVLTPNIWSYAKAVVFDSIKIKGLAKKIHDTKLSLFQNVPLDPSLGVPLQAEIIYQAYKPVNISYNESIELLKSIPDCSDHLSTYHFPKDGYEVQMHSKRDVRIRTDAHINPEVYTLPTLIHGFDTASVTNIRQVARSLVGAGRFKMEKMSMKDIFFLFHEDDRFHEFAQHEACTSNDRYIFLLEMRDFLGLYLRDTLKKKILEFFTLHGGDVSHMWENYRLDIQTHKRRNVLSQQLKMSVSDNPSDDEVANIIAASILQKSNILASWRKKIEDEIKKYTSSDGGEIRSERIALRAFVSKNQASFFAKASAGLCSARDVAIFCKPNHFHVNIVDEVSHICMGNLMAYDIDHNGKKVLLLRGFNPNTSLLKKIDVVGYCEAMIEIMTQFACENNFSAIYMSDPLGRYQALSNREEVSRYLMKKYGRSPETKIVHITSFDTIDTIYPILNLETDTHIRNSGKEV